MNNTDWVIKKYIKGDRQKLKEITRIDSLFLSVGAQWNNEQLSLIYNWFSDNVRDLPAGVEIEPITASLLEDSEESINKSKNLKDVFVKWMQNADFGICDIKVNKKRFDKEKIRFPFDVPDNIKEKIYNDLKKVYKIELVHKTPDKNISVALPFNEESDGTRRFFQMMGLWWDTLLRGLTVFIDELDFKLHSLLTRELIKFIHNFRIGDVETQLIFTTHDTTLLDPSLFRRDQIWFIERNKEGSSILYPLTDYKPRRDEAMQRGYLSGRYGAIPILEAFELYDSK